jgi:fructokinase
MTGQTTPPVIAGIGEVLWDLLPDGKQPGGAPANFAFHAGMLGARSSIVSSVGADAPGSELISCYRERGIDTRWVIRDQTHPTGTVSVDLDRDGIPVYTIHERVAWDYLRMDSLGIEQFAASCDAVSYGTLAQRSPVSRAAIRRFIGITQKTCLRVFDINLRQRFFSADLIDSLLRVSTVLKLNDAELPVVCDLLGISGSESKKTGELVSRYNLNYLALTRGAQGSYLLGTEGESGHNGFPAEIADTVGAGDAFTAALTRGLLLGMPLDMINEAANRIAAFVCSRPGGMPKLPDELVAMFR